MVVLRSHRPGRPLRHPGRAGGARGRAVELAARRLRGCSDTEDIGADQFNWCGKSGSLEVFDPTPDRGNVLRASVIAPAGAGTLALTVAGTKSEIAIGPDATPIELTVPPGRDVVIQFTTDVPALAAPGDSRDLRFRLVFPQVSTGP